MGIGEDDKEKSDQAVEQIKSNIQNLGLKAEGLNISMDGDTAVVAGEVADQATKEKIVLTIGNTSGIASVNDQLSVEKQEPPAKYYTVESGDTLSAIAQEFYGSAGKYPVIFEANKPMLTDPNKIYPGQKLRIPAEA